MMVGGSLMLLFGLLLMLGVVGPPVLLIVAGIAGVLGLSRHARSANPDVVIHQQYKPIAPSAPIIRTCSHCGQEIQSEWTHCPHCGAAVR